MVSLTATEQTNATLLAVLVAGDTGGGTDAYEQEPAAPAAGDWSWVGRAGCWFEEKVDRVTSAGGSTRKTIRTLIVPDRLHLADGSLWAPQQGDQLSLDHGTGPITGRVQESVRKPAAPGDPGEFRLVFEVA